MKIVGDAFAGELKIDDDLNTRRDKVKALQQEKGEAKRANPNRGYCRKSIK